VENDCIVALKGAIQVNEAQLRSHIDDAVRGSVEETLSKRSNIRIVAIFA